MYSKVCVSSGLKKYAYIKDWKVLGLLEIGSSKSNSILIEKCFQKLFEDLDNTTIPYRVCLDAWNELQQAGTPTGVLTAKCLWSDFELCDSALPDAR